MPGKPVPPPQTQDDSWSSVGLKPSEALSQWQHWAAQTIAPIDVRVVDVDGFAARWSSHGVGQLRLLQLIAPAQRVVHCGTATGAGQAAPSIQLVYARHGALKTRVGHDRFTLGPGDFVLLDNTRFYRMDMDGRHEAIDLMMPHGWIERYLPDPDILLGRPISARSGWAAPLGSLIETMADKLDESPLPRPLIAEQVGTLLALAAGYPDVATGRHRSQLAQRIFRRIEGDFDDPELSAGKVASELGISKRTVQALLAARGTSFVRELNVTRLDRACDLLGDPRTDGLAIGDIAWRCGFLDPGYFARAFRKRYGVAPRLWRNARAAGHD